MTEETGGIPRDLDVNGITLRVTTWGTSTDPDRAILLVHGITANSRYWSGLGPALAARGWQTIATDLRGRGRSAKPPHGYGIPFHVNDLLALCDALVLSRVNLVGHSLGALIGLYLAAVHPHRMGKLVLVDAGGKLPADTIQAITPALARLGTVYPSLDAYLGAMRDAVPVPWDPFWEEYFRYDAEMQPDGSVTSSVPKAAVAEEQAVNWATRTEALPEFVHAPTLIVRVSEGLLGGNRGLILPVEEAERMRSVIAGSRVVEIVNANHYTVVQAERFTEELTAFLEELT